MRAGDVLSFYEMCTAENIGMLQHGMNFRPPPQHGVILMSQRADAPYADTLDDDGNLLYEGHDVPRSGRSVDPKSVDQPRVGLTGRPTRNGQFADWADRSRSGEAPQARFHVYEKLQKGIWSFRGSFLLKDYRFESDGRRRVFRFVLQAAEEQLDSWSPAPMLDAARQRQIPTSVKVEVYRRDKGQCVLCGSTENLHFDHDLPFSKGGTSLSARNVQLLCMRHNLEKGARIE